MTPNPSPKPLLDALAAAATEDPGSALAHLGTVAVERAAADLRKGLPVVVEGDTPLVVAPAEGLSAAVLRFVREVAAGPAHATVTGVRADTLKIRRYTGEVAVVALPEENTLTRLAALADPAGDLDTPLKGPFDTLRTMPPGPVAEGLRLTKIAALLPAMIFAPLPSEAAAAAPAAGLTRVSAAAVRDYDLTIAETLRLITAAHVPLAASEDTRLLAFRAPSGGPEHYAVVIGEPAIQDTQAPLVRLHSECFTGDLLGSLKCDCGEQLRGALARIAAEGRGVLLYLAHEGRGIGLTNKLRAYHLQDQGFDTVEANTRLGFDVDERAFQPAAEMLKRIGVTSIRLLTNNPGKIDALQHHGITVTERVHHAFDANPHNADYLSVKKDKTGHLL